jgi:hypothetical protein
MLSEFQTRYNSIKGKRKKLRILTWATHEGYQSNLASTGHDFYLVSGPNQKQWDFHTRSLPINTYIIGPLENLNIDLSFDLILSQERFTQLPQALHISNSLKIPTVHLEHIEVNPTWTEKHLNLMKSMRATKHVYITEHNKKSWGGLEEDTVIRHGIDTNIFKNYGSTINKGISLVNHFASRDIFCGWNLWNEVIKEIGEIRLIGENPGISQSINDPVLLAKTLSSHRYFLNTSQLSPIPLSLLEAAACGLPIVSTSKQEIPKIFKHGESALLSNDPKELIQYCRDLTQDPVLARKLGDAARQVILDNFSMDKFTQNWNKILWEAYDEYYG